jgi:transposase-like protein
MRRRNDPTKTKARGVAATLRGRYWRAAEAARVLAAWRASGQSLTRFAGEHGLSRARLARWRQRLPGQGATAPVFHPVRVVVDPRAEAKEASREGALELVLNGGRRIRIGPEFDAELLAEVVRVVEGWPC